MIGKPKYKKGDVVTFNTYTLGDIQGTIVVVDAYGVFEDDTDVHYDIETEDCIFKHIKETNIID